MNEVTCNFIHRPLLSHRRGSVQFSYVVNRIDVELSHWREPSHEWLTNSTGQYYWEIQWDDKLDLLSSSTALPIMKIYTKGGLTI